MNKTKKGLLYAGYILLVTTFWLFYLFPVDAVKKYISFALAETYPGLNLTVEKAKPAFPAGLRLQTVEFYHHRSLLFTAEQVKITPHLLTLFSSTIKLAFKGRAYGGTIEGQVKVIAKPAGNKVAIGARLAEVQIKEIAALQNLAGRQIEGLLEGRANYDIGNVSGRNLNADLILSECMIELVTPIFNIEEVNFSKIEAEVVLSNRTLQLKQCNFKGDQMDGTLAGPITLKKPLMESVISLSGTISPHPELLASFPIDKNQWNQSGLPIRLSGTIAKPFFFLQ